MTRTDCADTGIIRTTTRQELLYTRSHIVVTAKAFGLGAIDMVRSNPSTFLSDVVLTEEDKQAIAKVLEEHPVKGGRYFGQEANWLWG